MSSVLKSTGPAPDGGTAAAFAESWNRQAAGSVYTREQFVDWFRPLEPESFAGESVLELGFGNGSLLYHMASYGPTKLCGIELGDTLETARANLRHLHEGVVELHRGDLTTASLGSFDFVYCIGVLHHLKDPVAGFDSVMRHCRPGGRFHCWVYGHEGNGLVLNVIDPLRRVTSRLPWWVTKFGIALPLVLPYYVYAKLLRAIFPKPDGIVTAFPLGAYSYWIAARELGFFHHVAFDQLVTPQTSYHSRDEVEAWLHHPDVDRSSAYVLARNGNSWIFGGRKRMKAS